MKTEKKIHPKNHTVKPPYSITVIATYWFLWDKLQAEWIRTILVIFFIVHIIAYIHDVIYNEYIDIFQDK